jgi:inorganic pyrophosphatase
MHPDKISPGKNVPDDLHVIIEIAAESDPIKYEVDKESGALFVDRFVATGMRYPCNYGYIPGTLAEDGDPADVLVVTPFPIMPGAVIRVRPIGILKMEDESGIDGKILAVPVDKLSPRYKNVNSKDDLDESILAQIEHFFEHYKKLEPGKWVKIDRWENAESARKEVLDCIERYKKSAA